MSTETVYQYTREQLERALQDEAAHFAHFDEHTLNIILSYAQEVKAEAPIITNSSEVWNSIAYAELLDVMPQLEGSVKLLAMAELRAFERYLAYLKSTRPLADPQASPTAEPTRITKDWAAACQKCLTWCYGANSYEAEQAAIKHCEGASPAAGPQTRKLALSEIPGWMLNDGITEVEVLAEGAASPEEGKK